MSNERTKTEPHIHTGDLIIVILFGSISLVMGHRLGSNEYYLEP